MNEGKESLGSLSSRALVDKGKEYAVFSAQESVFAASG